MTRPTSRDRKGAVDPSWKIVRLHTTPLRSRLAGFIRCAMVMMVCIASVGCESYALRGKVIEGQVSTLAVVSKTDPRLTDPGIKGATLMFMLDPTSGRRKDLGSTYTSDDGSFEMPVDATGAGLLEYELQVIVRSKGKAPVFTTIKLPGAGKRLLITLTPGADRLQIEPDPHQEIRQFMPAK